MTPAIVLAMPITLSDAEIKELMKLLARAADLNLTDERVERDLPAYKGHLAAIERIRTVTLPVEMEPFRTVKREVG